MNRLKKASSLISLRDECRKSFSSIKSRFFSISKNDLTKNNTHRFTSHIGASNVSLDAISDIQTEEQEIITQILDEEDQFLLMVKQFNRDSMAESGLGNILLILERYIEEKYFPNLKKSENEASDFIQSILENEELFIIYKDLVMEIHKLGKQQELVFIEEHLTKFSIFLQQLIENTSETLKDSILKIVNHTHQLINIHLEFEIRDIILEIHQEYKIYIERTEQLLKTVVPLLEFQFKYSKHKKRIIGEMPKIYELEKELFVEIEDSLKKCDFEEVAYCILSKRNLLDLYDEHVKSTKARIFKMAFCQDNQLDRNWFSLVINHLMTLKFKFSDLLRRCQKYRIEHRFTDKLVILLHEKIKRLDLISSTGNIVGLKSSDHMGDLLMRAQFGVKERNKPAYDSTVFVFEKAIVFTEEKLLGKTFCYNCKDCVSTDLMVYQTQDDNEILLYINSGNICRDILIYNNQPEHGSIEKLRDVLNEIVLRQITQIKQNHTLR